MIGQIIPNKTGAIELDRKAGWKDEGFIILCVIPKKGEFVTWWQAPNGSTESGHYLTNLKDAMEDFGKRL